MSTTIDAGWLRQLGEDGLAALLGRRPDAASPPEPLSLAELADRLCQPVSVVAALRRLDRPTLQVAEALAALGGEADRDVLHGLLGSPQNVSADDVERSLETLRDHALLTGHDRPQLIEAAWQAWVSPLGLGVLAGDVLRHRTADELRAHARNLGLKPAGRKADLLKQVLDALRDPHRVRQVVAAAPADVQKLLRRVAQTGEQVLDFDYYSPTHRAQPRGPVQWATSRGLLLRTGGWATDLVMPAEAALALRGPDWTAPFDPVPPRPPAQAVDAASVAADAAAAGAAMLRLVSALLDEAGRKPIAVLKAGGVGVRELRRLTKRIGCADPDLRLALAVAYRSGLLAFSADGGAPTEGYDDWLRDEPADRLAALIRAWWSLPYVPTAESEGAWAPDDSADGTVRLRATLLAEAAALSAVDEPVSVVEPAALADLALWRQPYAFTGPQPQQQAVACWQEAALLGVVGAGGLAPVGRILVGDGDLAAALADLGTTERSVRIQADLTAIVTGTPSAELTALLDEAAERESRGAASTWRFTPESVRRALDAGQPAESLLAALAAVAVGGLPQPLDYLVRDVTRRHGAIRGQDVACCLRAEDSALLAQIAADRRLRNLGLRAVAPTVLVGAKPLAETLAGLRAAGYAPVAEHTDGTPVLERPQPRRAPAPDQPRGPASAAALRSAAPTDAGKLARTLLDRPDVVAAPSSPLLETMRTQAHNLSESEARLLVHSIVTDLPVSISYINRAGNISSRTIEGIELVGGALVAWCRLRDGERMFNLSRVLSVAPAMPD